METITKLALCVLASFVITEAMPAEKFGMPTACAKIDFCTKKHDLYPVELVERMLRSANLTFVGVDTSQRVDEGSGEERDCAVITDNDPIYEIVDSDGHVRVVLQSESSGFQKVAIERCLNPGHIDHKTHHFDLEVVNKFNLQCMEQKMKIGFIVLTKDWTGLEMVAPKSGIPVRCECKFFKN